jgi:hypothetical protein
MTFIIVVGAVALTRFSGHFSGASGSGVFQAYTESASVTAGGFGVAMIAALWAYDGWNQSSCVRRFMRRRRRHVTRLCNRYCAEEVIDVGKVMPRCAGLQALFGCASCVRPCQSQHDRSGHRHFAVRITFDFLNSLCCEPATHRYVLMNAAYIACLSPIEMAESKAVGRDAARCAWAFCMC